MKIILTGPKGAGKTTLGRKTAKYLDIPFFDMDREVAGFTCSDTEAREKHEYEKLYHLVVQDKFFISTGWRTFLNKKCIPLLSSGNFIVLLKADEIILRGRLKTGRKTDYYDNFSHAEYLSASDEIYRTVEPYADLIIEIDPFKKSGFHRFMADEILKKWEKGPLL
jgi:shikimate kinase